MVIGPDGELKAKYHKMHPFDVEIKNGPAVRESERICPGNEIVTVDTNEVGHWGFLSATICVLENYTVSWLLRGAEILFVPSRFHIKYG